MASWFSLRSSHGDIQRKFKDSGKKTATSRDVGSRQLKRLGMLQRLFSLGSSAAEKSNLKDFILEEKADIAFVVDTVWGSHDPNQASSRGRPADVDVFVSLTNVIMELIAIHPELFQDGWLAPSLGQLLGSMLHHESPSKCRVLAIRAAVRWLGCAAGLLDPPGFTQTAVSHFSSARMDTISKSIKYKPVGRRQKSNPFDDQPLMVAALLQEMLASADTSFICFLYLHELWISQYVSELYPASCNVRSKSPLTTPLDRQVSIDMTELFAMNVTRQESLNFGARPSLVSTNQSDDDNTSTNNFTRRSDAGASDLHAVDDGNDAVRSISAAQTSTVRSTSNNNDRTIVEPTPSESNTLNHYDEINKADAGLSRFRLETHGAVEEWYIEFFTSADMRLRALSGFLIQQHGILPIVGSIFHAIFSGFYRSSRRADEGPDKRRVGQARRIISIYNNWTSAKVIITPPDLLSHSSDSNLKVDQDKPASPTIIESKTDNDSLETCAERRGVTMSYLSESASKCFEQLGASYCEWLVEQLVKQPNMPHQRIYFPSLGHMTSLHDSICSMLSQLFLPYWSTAPEALTVREYSSLIDEALCIYKLIILQSTRIAGVDRNLNSSALKTILDSLLTSTAILLSEMEMTKHVEGKTLDSNSEHSVTQLRKIISTTVLGWCRMALTVAEEDLDSSASSVRPFLTRFWNAIGVIDPLALGTWSKILLDIAKAIVRKSPAKKKIASSRDSRSLRREHSQLSPGIHFGSPDQSISSIGSLSRQNTASPHSDRKERTSRFRSMLMRSPSIVQPIDEQPPTSSTMNDISKLSTGPLRSGPRKDMVFDKSNTEISEINNLSVDVDSDFLNISSELGSSSQTMLQCLWACTYSLPGALRGMAPELHLACLKTFGEAFDLFSVVEPCSIDKIFVHGDPRLPIFFDELLNTIDLDGQYVQSKCYACQLICRSLGIRGHTDKLPKQTCDKLLVYFLRILREGDLNLKQTLTCSASLFFTWDISGSSILAPEFLRVIKALLLSENTMEYLSDHGTLYSPRTASMTILGSCVGIFCSLSCTDIELLQASADNLARESSIEECQTVESPTKSTTPTRVLSPGDTQNSAKTPPASDGSLSSTPTPNTQEPVGVLSEIAYLMQSVAITRSQSDIRHRALDLLCNMVHSIFRKSESSSDERSAICVCIDTLLGFTGHVEIGIAALMHLDSFSTTAKKLSDMIPSAITSIVDVVAERLDILWSRSSLIGQLTNPETTIVMLQCLRNWLICGYIDGACKERALKLLIHISSSDRLKGIPIKMKGSASTGHRRSVSPSRDPKTSPEKNQGWKFRNSTLPANVKLIEDAIMDVNPTSSESTKFGVGRSPNLLRRRPSGSFRKRISKAKSLHGSSTLVTHASTNSKIESTALQMNNVDETIQQVAQSMVTQIRCVELGICGVQSAELEVDPSDENCREPQRLDDTAATQYFACNGNILALTEDNDNAWELVLRSLAQRTLHKFESEQLLRLDSDTDTDRVSVTPDQTVTTPDLNENASTRQKSVSPLQIGKEIFYEDEKDGDIHSALSRHKSAPADATTKFEFNVEEIPAPEESPVHEESPPQQRRRPNRIPWDDIQELISSLGLAPLNAEIKFVPIPWTSRLPMTLRREKRDPRPVRDQHKIAVICVKEGELVRQDIMSCSSGGAAFDNFASQLGQIVEVGSQTRYHGGLSPMFDGSKSTYYSNFDVEVIFQVSPWLVTNEESDVSASPSPAISGATSSSESESSITSTLFKKRWKHVGNCEVHVIWCEDHGRFHTDQLPSDYGAVTIVIHPIVNTKIERGPATHCWIQIIVKSLISQLPHLPGPLLHGSIVAMVELPILVRITAINLARTVRLYQLKSKNLPPYHTQRAEWLRDVTRLRDFGRGRSQIFKKASSLPDADSTYGPERSLTEAVSVTAPATPVEMKKRPVSAEPGTRHRLHSDSDILTLPGAHSIPDEENLVLPKGLQELATLSKRIRPLESVPCQPRDEGMSAMSEEYRNAIKSKLERIESDLASFFSDLDRITPGGSVDVLHNWDTAKKDPSAVLDYIEISIGCDKISQISAIISHCLSEDTPVEIATISDIQPGLLTGHDELEVVLRVPEGFFISARLFVRDSESTIVILKETLGDTDEPLRRRIEFGEENDGINSKDRTDSAA